MMTVVTMPQLGEGVSEGTIGRWLKHPGERVEKDEPLVEVITEKVNAEVPSPAAGTLVRILAPEGERVPVLAPIAEIDESSAAAAPPPEPAQAAVRGAFDGRATPAVRRLARELGVDLADAAAARAPGAGRLSREDVLAHSAGRGSAVREAPPSAAAPSPPAAPPSAAASPSTPQAPAPAAASPAPNEEIVPLPRMRHGIAAQMTRAGAVPHAYVTTEIDMTPLVRRRASIRAEYQAREGISIGFVPFVVKAVVDALRRHSDLNAHWTEQGLVRKRRINVGVAVAVEGGLLVPVVQDADQLSVNGLNHAIVEVAARARDGHLRVGDLKGGTFTVDNAGAFGSVLTVPLLNVPEIAIVTMEAIVKRPVVREEAGGDVIAVRSMMTMVAGFDHRATDGAQVGRFLQDVRAWLESVDEQTPIW
jgi:2-oxoisovalerate dehydrogenase E2 component (dihydrolipoyl transacylase)